MCVCACVRVCMRVCVRACVHACVRACVHARAYASAQLFTAVLNYSRISLHFLRAMYIFCVCVYTCICECVDCCSYFQLLPYITAFSKSRVFLFDRGCSHFIV